MIDGPSQSYLPVSSKHSVCLPRACRWCISVWSFAYPIRWLPLYKVVHSFIRWTITFWQSFSYVRAVCLISYRAQANRKRLMKSLSTYLYEARAPTPCHKTEHSTPISFNDECLISGFLSSNDLLPSSPSQIGLSLPVHIRSDTVMMMMMMMIHTLTPRLNWKPEMRYKCDHIFTIDGSKYSYL